MGYYYSRTLGYFFSGAPTTLAEVPRVCVGSVTVQSDVTLEKGRLGLAPVMASVAKGKQRTKHQ